MPIVDNPIGGSDNLIKDFGYGGAGGGGGGGGSYIEQASGAMSAKEAWQTWSANGWAQDTAWAQAAGAHTSPPDMSLVGARSNGIWIPGEATLDSAELRFRYTNATLHVLVGEIWGLTIADGDVNPSSGVKYATLAHTAEAVAYKEYIQSYTIDVDTIPANTSLWSFLRRTDYTGAVSFPGALTLTLSRV